MCEDEGVNNELIFAVDLLDADLEAALDVEVPDEGGGGVVDEDAYEAQGDGGGHQQALCFTIHHGAEQFIVR